MDRLYTAFVSSTFLDLREERQRLVSVLLDHRCVPFGMEFFPSTGRSQWPIIRESIQAADLCVFVVAGRYGTMSDDGAISWTHREFREAVAEGKPISGILHADPRQLPLEKSEQSRRGQRALAAFRKEIEAQTVCRYYHNEADLVQAVTSSISVLIADKAIAGWVPAGTRPVVLQESDFDRVYDLVESDYTFAPSLQDPRVWDAKYRGKRVVIGQDPSGLAMVSVDFTRDSDREVPDALALDPKVKLLAAVRPNGGMSLREPRRHAGASFVQDVVFNPPVAPDEVVGFDIEAELPRFRFARSEELVRATMTSRMGPRTFDWLGRNIVYPTRRLVLSAFLPDDLGATPRGPMVMRSLATVDDELTQAVIAEGYTLRRDVRGGSPGVTMQLELKDLRVRRRYRLAWDLPPSLAAP